MCVCSLTLIKIFFHYLRFEDNYNECKRVGVDMFQIFNDTVNNDVSDDTICGETVDEFKVLFHNEQYYSLNEMAFRVF